MPGQTNNNNLVSGLNEAIVSLNDLAQKVTYNAGNPDDVGTLIGDIATQLGDIKTAIETEAVAQIVAQNSNFSDLSTVLANLRLFCQSVTSVNIANFYAPYIPASTVGGEGIPPPEPFQDVEGDEGYYNTRKCYVATRITDEMVTLLNRWESFQLDEMVNLSFAAMLSAWVAAIAAYLSETVIFGISLGSVAGYLDKIVAYMLSNIGGVEFANIATAIVDNRADLICALYSAASVDFARGDFDSVLQTAGLGVVDRGFVVVMLDFTTLNYLFYTGDADVEAALAIEGNEDCSGCDVGCNPIFSSSTILSQSPGTIEYQPYVNPSNGQYYVVVFFDATTSYQLCGGAALVSNFVITSGTFPPATSEVRMWDHTPSPGEAGNLYHSTALPSTPIGGVRVMTINSVQQYTIQFDYVSE